MATDYASQASQIYDPQQQAESIGLERQKASSLQGLNEEEQTIDPYYNDAIKSAKDIRLAEGARQDLSYSTALSGQRSGLLDNQQDILGKQLIDTTGKIESERVQKKSNIAARRRLVGDDYTAGMSALAAKYAGLKSTFIADRTFTAEQNEANRRASIAATRSYGGGSSSSGGGGYSASRDSGGGYAFSYNGKPISAGQYYAENGGIGALAQAFAQSGNKGDQQIAKDINAGVSPDVLRQRYPHVFQGV